VVTAERLMGFTKKKGKTFPPKRKRGYELPLIVKKTHDRLSEALRKKKGGAAMEPEDVINRASPSKKKGK